MKDNNQNDKTDDLSEMIKKLQEENPDRKVVIKIVPPPKVGFLWCLLGGYASVGMPEFGALMIAYGVVIAAANRSEKYRAGAALAAILPILLQVTSVSAMVTSYALVASIAGFALSGLVMQDKASISNELLITGLISCLLLVLNINMMTQQGLTTNEYIMKLFDAQTSAYMKAGVDQYQLAIAQAREVYTSYWPLAFCLSALLMTVFARWGATRAARMIGLKVSRKQLDEYDNPLWIVLLLALGIIAVKFGQKAPTNPKLIIFIGNNLLGAVRFFFAIQGYAVGLYFLKKYPRSILLGFVYLILAFYLEVNFMIVSVVGFVDVWANFRGLYRQD